jgi:mannose-6-phosphate isomerase-like protein (cupin superfamily)
MTSFDTKRLPAEVDEVAPDGSDVRVLLGLAGGLMGHHLLKPGQVSRAIKNQTVEEIWFFLSGRGLMWRKQAEREEVVPLESGVCITIPLGTHFQFRCFGDEPLVAVGVTMPPWPGRDEAIFVDIFWETASDSN